MKNIQIKVGDNVTLTSKLPSSWNTLMSNYLGTSVKITKIDNNSRIYFNGSEPWYFSVTDVVKVNNVSGLNETQKLEKVVNDLLVANNTCTTLEVKTELRRQYPKNNWTQSLVSDSMKDLATQGKLQYTDNGTYRVYSLVTKSTNNKTKDMTKTTQTKSVANTTKKQRISRTKAISLISGTNGRFFGVTFTKKDGSIRRMKCKIEKDTKPTQLGYLNVTDVKENTIKSMNLQTLSEIRMDKKVYLVD